MPAVLSYPGVYVEERSSGARAIAGVSTSICAFIGMAERGRMGVPTRVFSIAEYQREFGPTSSGEMADQVRQFFLNGGGEAYVCRIANGAQRAGVTLNAESPASGPPPVLELRARDEGQSGNLIRAQVDYDTGSPERTFNLIVYRSQVLPDGSRSREETETFSNLSMDPASGTFVDKVVNGVSALVTAKSVAVPGAVNGLSVSGLILANAESGVKTALNAIVTVASTIRISVNNRPPVQVTLPQVAGIAATNFSADVGAAWTTAINQALSGEGITETATVSITDATLALGGLDSRRLLLITSAQGPVLITSATQNDAAVPLMLGVAAGGMEADTYGTLRPAPTGLAFRIGPLTGVVQRLEPLRGLISAKRADLAGFKLVDNSPEGVHDHPTTIALGTGPMFAAGGQENLGNVRAALDTIASSITNNVTNRRWTARRQGLRLVLTSNYETADAGLGAAFTTSGGFDLGGSGQGFNSTAAQKPDNVPAYTVGKPGGLAGSLPFQFSAVAGSDGTVPLPPDYAAAFDAIERDADIFNMMVLPRAEGQDDDDRGALWGPASAFCARERAFLIVDPRSDWTDIAKAETGADAIRIGVETRNAGCWWPQLRLADGTPAGKIADPGGSVAGVMARTDGARGIWKAAAGLEATVRGVVGVTRRMSDPENGVINPKALNAIRVEPGGVLLWGARTLIGYNSSGNVDDKYVPVRRTMLYIEESLYRGLKFAIFEPNDEPLWAQIRLAAGSFMNGLFRQGAFAGKTASDAYFVTCDKTTTTPTDINLGIVNVIVGFAPLKPAEFVVLTVTQMAGQVEV